MKKSAAISTLFLGTILMLFIVLASGSAIAQEEPGEGITNVKLSGTMVAGGDIFPYFDISADAAYVVYRADQETDQVVELFTVPIDGASLPIKLNHELPEDHAIDDVVLAPDSSRLVYGIEVEFSYVNKFIYSVPIDGSMPPIELDFTWHSELYWLNVSPDSYWVTGNITGEGLYRGPIDGSAAALPITDLFLMVPYAFCPDASMLVISGGIQSDSQRELFSLPFDGVSSPIKLNPVLDENEYVFGPEHLPNCDTIIFKIVFDEDGRRNLFSAPIDGSLPAVQLNSTLPVGGSVGSAEISPDGNGVVYMGQQDDPDVTELYFVPIDGSSQPSKLNPPMVSGGDVTALRIVPNGNYAVYRADQEVDGAHEYYRASLQGNPNVTKLSDHSTHGNSDYSLISSDSNRLVYLTQPISDTFNLYSVPIDASAPPIKLNPALTPGGSVKWAQISPDDNWVIYTADQEIDEVVELYAVPIDGSGPPIKLHPDLPSDHSVGLFRISPDGEWVVYIADQDQDEVYELYASTIPDAPSVTPSPTSTATATSTVTPTATLPAPENSIFLPITRRD